jgi:hypothetical protein
MADSFLVIQVKAEGVPATPSTENQAFQLAEDIRKLWVRVNGVDDEKVTIIDAFVDTAATSITEV